MLYKFLISTSLTEQEASAIAEQTVAGLEVSGELILRAIVQVNTELPDDKVTALQSAVAALAVSKLGAGTTIQLVSVEN